MMKFKLLIIGASIVLLPLLSNWQAFAQVSSKKIELKVNSTNQQKQSCPDTVIVSEQPQPYREGSFATDGSVNLSAYATNISVQSSNAFSVTWVGKLKPTYSKCFASAGITKVNGEPYSGQTNYLRMHFFQGKVYFILDLAGGTDPNDYPLGVLKHGLNNGNPVWTWGGSD